MTCESCGDKPKKCNKDFTKAVVEIDNPEQITLMRKVTIPASMGDDTTVPPVVGKYKNVLLYYEANQKSYLYSSDGIPTQLVNGITDYEAATNLPRINSHTLIGDKTAEQLGLQDKLTAGDNISIENNVISATDTTYGPATDTEIGLVKPGDGLEVASDGALSVSDIEQYAHFFDTVADMKAATNLSDGDYARTLGYYSVNDGGGALYKITDTGAANELDLIAIGSDLIAELDIQKNMSVKQFGAKGDGVNDDLSAISRMITKCNYLYIPAGNYSISSELTLGQLRDINIKGKIVYGGNNYAINFTGGSYLDVNIKSIEASNGGCIKIAPTTNPFSFNKINLEYGEASSHVIEMDGDGNAICNIFLQGIRWHSTASTPFNITMTNQASAGSFVNEIVIKDVNLWSKAKERAGLSTDNASNNEIQLKLDRVNFENSWGIHTVGKIVDISLTNCRIVEIKEDNGWLTFDGYLPKISIMGVGDNFLVLDKIVLNNISNTTTPFLTTNLTVQDADSTYPFLGGGVAYTDHFVPFIVPEATKTYDTTGTITYNDLSISGGNYNRFAFTGNGWVVFTIPTNLFYCTQNNILITTTYAISLTVNLSTGGGITFQTEANTTYILKKIGNSIKYIKLS